MQKKNLWQQLPKPFLVQAPMENVTDTVFRQIIVKAGKPDVFFTEFTNTDGLLSKGEEEVKKRLQFTQKERPIIAQIWGTNPESFNTSAKKIQKMGFDGIDINMGCPVKAVITKGSCSGLINNPKLAKEIIAATKSGANKLPVSVKTRIGFNTIQTEDWIGFLLDQQLAALTIHGRTTKEMSDVPAHWDEIGKAVQIRNIKAPETILIGNGDVESYTQALAYHKQYGVDGVMIGCGIFHNIGIFNKAVDPLTIPLATKLRLLITHIELFDATWGKEKPIEILKKFYKIYVSGMRNASEIRMRLMECKTTEETIALVREMIVD